MSKSGDSSSANSRSGSSRSGKGSSGKGSSGGSGSGTSDSGTSGSGTSDSGTSGSGTSDSGTSATRPTPRLPQAYRGADLGLPADGPGSLAPGGTRALAFLVDAFASTLVAALFVSRHGGSFADRLPGSWSLIPLAVDYVGGVLLTGRTLGMYPFGLRLARVDVKRDGVSDTSIRVDLVRVVLRTALLFLLVPALVFDRDGRGLHDRLTGTAVVRG